MKPQDYLPAVLHFDQHYKVAFQHNLRGEKRVQLPSLKATGRARLCRYCGRTRPNSDFSKRAHAVPELLGNRCIFSSDECDDCNEFFGNEYEDHLSKALMVLRSVTQVAGKKGPPTFKTPDESFRSSTVDQGLHIDLSKMTAASSGVIKAGAPGQISFSGLQSQPYIPRRAAMALIKAACSVCPSDQFHQCEVAIDWLMGRRTIAMNLLSIIYGFTPGVIPQGHSRVVLLQRRDESREPYFWFVVQMGNLRLQVFVPGCRPDQELFASGSAKVTTRLFPDASLDCRWPYGHTQWGMLDWASTSSHRESSSFSFVFAEALQHDE